ncbi:uncharacterized protein LOC143174492 [Nomia melanderi]|uniref:uncharacterized protein LOC143174492 n=1 Tax=Nomia melanderi TaxID=2448451 RepID=UPI003FCE8CC8
MERLYAVPSEKLRVWSVWLAKIGEIAGEWQRWLRSNIDIAVRIAEHLEAAEEAARRSEMEDDDNPGKVSSAVPGEVSSQSVRGESGDPGVQSSTEKSQHSAATGASSAEYEDAIGEPMERPVASVQDVSKSNIEEKPSDTTLKPENDVPTWPLGTPWTPQGEEEEEEEREEETLKKLPIPRNRQEMEKFVKDFTREAIIYRSYYKHWRETADQVTTSDEDIIFFCTGTSRNLFLLDNKGDRWKIGNGNVHSARKTGASVEEDC